MANLIGTLWNEPRHAEPPGPQKSDWLLVTAIALLVILEVSLRQGVVWQPLALVLCMAFTLTLPWRRRYPVPLIVLVFGANTLVQTYALLNGVAYEGLYTTALILVLPFALLRWGSGREAAAGLGFIALTFLTNISLEQPPWGEIVGAALFILFPSALGASLRYQDAAQRRANEQVRLREREQLARELHDTVGHYVSAIAVQAQAGRALAPTQAGAAVEALEVIETAASRALSEMRSILRAMRGDDAAAFAPLASVGDIYRLAESGAYPFAVELQVAGELSDLDTTIGSTLFRLTQESITNAVRHAQNATTVIVQISREPQQVTLRIEDDGDVVIPTALPGLGLTGMSERVSLLGGTLTTGPGADRGWCVEAVLPASGGIP